MNLALAMGALVLGQMINPSFDPGRPPSDQVIDQPNQGAMSFPDPQRWRPSGGRVDLPASRFGGGAQRLRGERQAPSREPIVPFAPTDPVLSSPDSSLWTAPTEGSSSSLPPGFGTPMGGARPGGSPMAHGGSSHYGRPQRTSAPTARQLPNLNALRQAQAARVEAMSRPSSTGRSLASSKPFSGFSPSAAVSPYMGMYRANQSQVDNYTNSVSSQLQAQQQSQHFGGEIRGLQSAARTQGHALQRLGKIDQGERGTMAPEYFNNYHQFYPMFGR